MAPTLQKPAHLRAYGTRCLREATFYAERKPKPHESNDCRLTRTLSVSDIRPPCSALASIGSTIGCGRRVWYKYVESHHEAASGEHEERMQFLKLSH